MKAIGINALVLNDDLEIIHREGTMIKAILNKDGKVSYEDVLKLNTLQDIKEYQDLQNFLDDLWSASRGEFGAEFNQFEIVWINEDGICTFVIRCVPVEDDVIYTFDDYTDKNIRFIETLVKAN